MPIVIALIGKGGELRNRSPLLFELTHNKSGAYNFAGYRLQGRASRRCGLWTSLVLDDVAANSANRKRLERALDETPIFFSFFVSLFHVDLRLLTIHYNTCSNAVCQLFILYCSKLLVRAQVELID